MPSPSRTVSRTRSALSRTLGWAAGLALVLPWVPVAVGTALGLEGLTKLGTAMAGMGMLLAPFLLLIAPFFAWVQARSSARLRVERDALLIERAGRVERIGRATIQGGVLVPSAKGLEVQLFLSGGDTVHVAVEDEAAGHALLDDLDLGADERRVRVELADPRRRLLLATWRLTATFVLWFFLLGMVVSWFEKTYGHSLPLVAFGGWLVGILSTFAGWQRLRRPPAVVVGSDGVRIERPFGDVTIPYPEIAKVWAQGAELFIRKTSGELVTVSGGLAAPGREPEAAASSLTLGIVRRIEEARRVHGEGTRAVASVLDRRGRSFEAWRAALKAAVSSDAGYRSAGLTLDDIAAALTDATLSPDQRLGAAIALREAAAPDARQRIRVAAGLTSGDELRVALERAAEEEVDAESLAEAAEAISRQR